MKRLRNGVVIAAVMASVLSLGTTAFADDTDQSSYSFQTGRDASLSRAEIYEKAMQIEDEEERAAFLESYGLNEEEWSEENAANYSWITGQERGSQYSEHDETEDVSGYSFNTGRASYEERHAVFE